MDHDLIPPTLRRRYRFEEREHACSILAGDFASEWKDLLGCLKAFSLKKSYIIKGGGGRSEIPQFLDGFLKERAGRKDGLIFRSWSMVSRTQPRRMKSTISRIGSGYRLSGITRRSSTTAI